MNDDGGAQEGAPEGDRDPYLDRRGVVKLTVGFAVALVLVYLLGVVVGWEETLERLGSASLLWVGVACLSTLLCLAVWGKMWQITLRSIGVRVPYRKIVVTFYAATFANYVTPMGQAGGEPFIAYVLSRDTEAGYEESLASVLTTDLLRLLPFFTAAGVGLTYIVLYQRLPERVEMIAFALIALAVVLPTVIVGGWWYRERLKGAIMRLLSPVEARTDLFTAEGVSERIDELYDSVDYITDSRRTVVASVGLGYVGWALFALPLYFSGLALDLPISLPLVLFVVPITIIVSFTPFPGGIGPIEGTVVLLLTTLAAVSAGDALAITTVYRLTSYWIVILVGGVAAVWVTARV